MEEVSVQVAKVQAPILIPKLDLGFGCRYRNQVLVVHYIQVQTKIQQTAVFLGAKKQREKNRQKMVVVHTFIDVQCKTFVLSKQIVYLQSYIGIHNVVFWQYSVCWQPSAKLCYALLQAMPGNFVQREWQIKERREASSRRRRQSTMGPKYF